MAKEGKLEKQIAAETKMQEEMMKQKEEQKILSQSEERLKGGVSVAKAPTGEEKKPPPNVGSTRKPSIVKKGMSNKST